jgi:NitT/TauT family transport system substrate-binding protein
VRQRSSGLQLTPQRRNREYDVQSRFCRGVTFLSLIACVCFSIGASAQNLEDVNYLMPAPATLPSFIPWVLAQQRGYYAKEGLNVTFQVAKGGVDVSVQVGAGNAPVGGGIGETTIITRAQGIPSKVVAVLGGGAFTQLVVHDGQGISGPKDLKGKTVTVLAYQDTSYYSLLGMLASVGLTKHDLDIEAAGPSGIWQLFAAGKAQAMAGTVNWALDARDAGAKIRIYRSDKYFPSMAQAIIASDVMIRTRPELIRKLVRATLKGMQDVMQQGDAVVPDYLSAVPTMKPKEGFVREVVSLYNEYVYAGQKVIGAMDPERLARVQKFYVVQDIVARESPLDQLYTNQFIQ